MSPTAKPSLHDNDALLTYRVGPVLCCGPTLPIVTITPPPAKLTHPPGTNIAEPGIFKHGSDIVSATDLRYRFGVKQENWKQPGQVIIAKHTDLTRGYFVDEIIDVTHFPETGWGQLPAYLPRGVFSRTLVINKKIYLYAEFEKLSQLQGSGYLSDYIAHLEGQLEKENKTTIDKFESKSSANRTEKKRKSEINRPETKLVTPSHTKVENTPTKDSPVEIEIKKVIPVDQQASLTTNHEKNSPRISKTAEASGKAVLQKSKKHNIKKEYSLKKTTNKPDPEKIKSDIDKPRQSRPLKNKTDAEIKIKEVQQSTEDNMATSPVSIDNGTSSLTRNKTLSSENNKAPQKENIQSEEKAQDSKAFSFLFIITILVLLSGGGYYYFLTHESSGNSARETNTNTNEYLADITESSLIKEEAAQKEITLPNKLEQQDSVYSEPSTETNAIPLQAEKTTIQPEVANNNNQQKIQQELTENNNPTGYHASINQDNTTITIELKGPLPPKVINTNPDVTNKIDLPVTIEKEPTSQHEALESNNKNTPDVSNNEQVQITTPAKQAEKESTIEIIHIIVKGDTLWAIAKHYLQNPFLYPELAKLSRIKNPDLIYPGNRVRIIYRAKN